MFVLVLFCFRSDAVYLDAQTRDARRLLVGDQGVTCTKTDGKVVQAPPTAVQLTNPDISESVAAVAEAPAVEVAMTCGLEAKVMLAVDANYEVSGPPQIHR